MSKPTTGLSRQGRFPGIPRKPAPVADGDLARTSFLEGLDGFPLVVRPAIDGLDAVAWAGAHRDWILHKLYRHGALLFRGFPVRHPDGFSRFARGLCPDLLDYQERAAPRTRGSGQGVHVDGVSCRPGHTASPRDVLLASLACQDSVLLRAARHGTRGDTTRG